MSNNITVKNIVGPECLYKMERDDILIYIFVEIHHPYNTCLQCKDDESGNYIRTPLFISK
jgi:hypothetical protein